jgi:hypothetical protein
MSVLDQMFIDGKSQNQFQEGSSPLYSVFTETIDGTTRLIGSSNYNYSYLNGQGYGVQGLYCTPFVYEPYSRALMFFVLERTRLDDYADTVAESGSVFYSQDLGKTWGFIALVRDTVCWNSPNINPFIYSYPTMTAANPTKSTNITDVILSCHLKLSTYPLNGKNQPPTQSSSKFFFAKLKDGSKKYVTLDMPLGNNNVNHVFSLMRGTGAVLADGKAYGLYYGLATQPTQSSILDNYSFALANFNHETFNNENLGQEDLVPTSFVFPDNLMNNPSGLFSEAPRAPNWGMSFLSADVDAEGTIYAAVNNFTNTRYLNDNYSDEKGKHIRTPIVMKAKISTMNDNSNFTFNDMDSLPESVIMQYLEQNNYKSSLGVDGNPWGFSSFNNGINEVPFSVIGPNKYSFMLPISFSIVDEFGSDAGFLTHLVEIANDNGKWSIRPVFKYENITTNWANYYDDVNGRRTYAPCDEIGAYPFNSNTINYRGPFFGYNYLDEQEISRTADGKYYVAKWLTCTPDTDFVNINKQTMYTRNMIGNTGDTVAIEIDRYYYNRMYLSYRHVDSANWSEPVRAFLSDTIPIRYTNMPSIVPSIREVPITLGLAMDQSANNPHQEKAAHPFIKKSAMVYHMALLLIGDATKNYTSIIEEGEPSTTSNLENAVPNPVYNDRVSFKFSLQSPAQTKLVVYNAMGQVVATLLDQYCNASVYSIDNFSTLGLPNGTYYFTLTSGSIVETKMFNVVR